MSWVNYIFLSYMRRFYILGYMLFNYYLKPENSFQYTKVRAYLNLLRIEIRYIVVEKRQKTYVVDINLVFVWDILCH
jgi:hypothetical protein